MADSLVLTGVKDIKKHTGTEMMLTRPKRGGDTHSLKEWWKTGSHKCYVSCTVFNVTTAAGTVKLALDTKGEGSRVRIDHDGAFNFSFYGMGEISRAALFTDTYELIEHYVFPRISGGKIMTVTPPGGAQRPSATPPGPTETLTGVSITGNQNVAVGIEEIYNYTTTGTASDVQYTTTSSELTDEIDSNHQHLSKITFRSQGPRTITVTATSANSQVTDDSIQATKSVNAFVLTTVGTVTISGDSAPSDGATGVVYSAAISGDAGNLSYAWSVTGAGSIDGSSTGSSVTIDWSGTDASVISCIVTSSDSGVTDSPQTGTLGGITPATVSPSSSEGGGSSSSGGGY